MHRLATTIRALVQERNEFLGASFEICKVSPQATDDFAPQKAAEPSQPWLDQRNLQIRI